MSDDLLHETENWANISCSVNVSWMRKLEQHVWRLRKETRVIVGEKLKHMKPFFKRSDIVDSKNPGDRSFGGMVKGVFFLFKESEVEG